MSKNMQTAKKTILVVEDDADMVEIYKEILHEKYNILFARDTAEARKQLAAKDVDLVILDIILPKEMGNILFDEMMSDPRYRKLSIIIVSVVKEFAAVVAGKDPTGRTVFIAKPFEKKVLMDMIEKKLRK